MVGRTQICSLGKASFFWQGLELSRRRFYSIDFYLWFVALFTVW